MYGAWRNLKETNAKTSLSVELYTSWWLSFVPKLRLRPVFRSSGQTLELQICFRDSAAPFLSEYSGVNPFLILFRLKGLPCQNLVKCYNLAALDVCLVSGQYQIRKSTLGVYNCSSQIIISIKKRRFLLLLQN